MQTQTDVNVEVAEWLRKFAREQPYRSPGAALLDAARRIEAGEHQTGA